MTHKDHKSWLNYVVEVNLGRQRHSVEFRDGLATLKRLETWLQKNHLPLILTDEFGQPKSGTVTVFFDSGEAEKALAFRSFCNELGLSSTLKFQRVRLNREPRTTGDT